MEVHMQTPHQEKIALHVTDSYESTAILLSSWLYVHTCCGAEICAGSTRLQICLDYSSNCAEIEYVESVYSMYKFLYTECHLTVDTTHTTSHASCNGSTAVRSPGFAEHAHKLECGGARNYVGHYHMPYSKISVK